MNWHQASPEVIIQKPEPLNHRCAYNLMKKSTELIQKHTHMHTHSICADSDFRFGFLF